MNNRVGNWIQTYTGIQFFPLDPRIEEIDIEDIAHALSMTCRFGGHCLNFYSVAEHCCLMYDKASDKNKFHALMHDASEAYITDVPRPLKPSLTNYKEIETHLMNKICEKYDLDLKMPAEVKTLDVAILFAEANQNMSPASFEWEGVVEPLDVELRFWSPTKAKVEFLNRFEQSHNG
jgi:hypothetical protein